MRSPLPILLLAFAPALGAAAEPLPAPACLGARPGSIAELVCRDPALSELDRQMAGIYAQARLKALHEKPPVLAIEQRGWLRGRDDCWKALDDKRACVAESYRLRIVELQARYRLVPMRGPFRWQCGDSPADELVVHFFATEPPSLVAERGDSVSLMRQTPAASGARYEGRNEMFWEHQGEALLRWGYQAPELRCKPRVSEAPIKAG